MAKLFFPNETLKKLVPRVVDTNSDEALSFWRQGFLFESGYDHDNARDSFLAAAKIDENCGMAWWGAAFALSPNIHVPYVSPSNSSKALDDIEHGLKVVGGSTPEAKLAKELLDALTFRFSRDPEANRGALNSSYREAMKKVWENHQTDPDIGSLYADALMVMRPWAYWKPNGEPEEGTLEMCATLERVLQLEPNHAMALHFTIHAWEASKTPKMAEQSGDRLLGLEPHLIGHLEHMPSHIYVLLGRWQDAVNANVAAARSDKALIKAGGVKEPKTMLSFFMAHNHHTLAFAASAIGQSKLALEHIYELMEIIPEDAKKILPHFADFFSSAPYEFFIRLGEWEKMLALPTPDPDLFLSTAMYHACRALSLAALKRPSEARAEQTMSLQAVAKLNLTQKYLANTAQNYVDVLIPFMEGEILISEDKREQAVQQLRSACDFLDKLNYEHPPMFIVSPRHPLGALLIGLGRPEEAIEIYKKDLTIWPNNGWSLKGLHQGYSRFGREEEAQQFKKKFDEVWIKADMKTGSSCCCLPMVES